MSEHQNQLSEIQRSLGSLEANMEIVKLAVLGNGKPGLLTRVEQIELVQAERRGATDTVKRGTKLALALGGSALGLKLIEWGSQAVKYLFGSHQ